MIISLIVFQLLVVVYIAAHRTTWLVTAFFVLTVLLRGFVLPVSILLNGLPYSLLCQGALLLVTREHFAAHISLCAVPLTGKWRRRIAPVDYFSNWKASPPLFIFVNRNLFQQSNTRNPEGGSLIDISP